jgi:hypothetical protein
MLLHVFASIGEVNWRNFISGSTCMCWVKESGRHCGNCLLPFHSNVITLDTLGVQPYIPSKPALCWNRI